MLRNNFWCRLLALILALLACVASGQAQPKTGYIQIIANADVSVFIDGKLAGLTSSRDQGLVVTGVSAGAHRLRFEREGFEPHVTKLSVAPDEVTVYRLYSLAPRVDIQEDAAGRTGYMEPSTGVLELVCLPVYCTVSIPQLELDNYQKQSSTLTIREALATRYLVTIRVGKARLQKTVELEPNTTLRLFANFADGKPLLETTVKRLKVQRVQTPKPAASQIQSFEATLEQPLAVLIDNADAAYPQGGLVEAASVFEMPVERGFTTLMSVYTKDDPAQVGPVEGARDYFLEAALALNGTLVHVGGSPSALSRIMSQGLATVDALEQSALFAQAQDRSAPHSTFSTGAVLRDAVGRVPSQVSGTLYAPPADADDVSSLTVGYSAEYTSGFRYLSELDQYRWLRSGADAVDAAGTAVAADAVIVARVVAFPYSGDPEGRLYLPYSGGAATLYLRGKAVPGTWTPEGGFSFFAPTGVEVDLTPFKHWILFAPEAAQVTVQ